MPRINARRKYLVNADDSEVLHKKDVEKILPDIVSRIPERNIATLNRIIMDCGYRYYSNHAIRDLIDRLRRLGFKVRRVSKRRYVIFREDISF